MATCIDPNCTIHFKGEVVPVAVEIKSNEGSYFEIISDNVRTYCEVRDSSGVVITKLYPTVQTVSDTVKRLMCSWDTATVDSGYFILRYWISVSLAGATDPDGKLHEDYRLVSEELKRYVRSEG